LSDDLPLPLRTELDEDLEYWGSEETFRAILGAGKLTENEDSIFRLSTELFSLSLNYPTTMFPTLAARHRWLKERRDECRRISKAATELLELVPGAPFSGNINESILAAYRDGERDSELQGCLFAYGVDPRETAAALRRLRAGAIEAERFYARTDEALGTEIHGGRGKAPETELFLRLRDLFVTLGGGRGPGAVGGPLYRFVSACVELIDKGISMPAPKTFLSLIRKAIITRQQNQTMVKCPEIFPYFTMS
jgi:hypothetical protein